VGKRNEDGGEPGATAQRPQLSRPVRAHVSRQPGSWLTCNVGQKNMVFTSQLGRCLILCQRAEFFFCAIIMLRRMPGSKDYAAFVKETASVRSDFFGRIRNELLACADGLIDPNELDDFVSKRNWLVHHLIFDPRYFSTAKKGGFDLSAEIKFFTEKTEYFGGIYKTLAEKAGVHKKISMTVEEALPYMTQFAASVSTEVLKKKLERKRPNQALQHNDPSCHESCLRTPRASRGRG